MVPNISAALGSTLNFIHFYKQVTATSTCMASLFVLKNMEVALRQSPADGQ